MTDEDWARLHLGIHRDEARKIGADMNRWEDLSPSQRACRTAAMARLRAQMAVGNPGPSAPVPSRLAEGPTLSPLSGEAELEQLRRVFARGVTGT